jgi:hypothetical protein
MQYKWLWGYPDLLDTLHVATENFAHYLRANSVRVEAGVTPSVRQAMTIE